ncbi:MAG: hypothetical protein QM773_05510 [Hyphomonadaceae bacterium]
MNAIAELQRLISEAEKFDEDYELDQMPAYGAVLAHLRANPEHRPAFGQMLIARLEIHGDAHLFEFCMGALKWPELESQLRSLMLEAQRRSDRRAEFFYASCLRCFDED